MLTGQEPVLPMTRMDNVGQSQSKVTRTVMTTICGRFLPPKLRLQCRSMHFRETELQMFCWCVEEHHHCASATRDARAMDLANSRSAYFPSHIGATNLDLRFVSNGTNAKERQDLYPSRQKNLWRTLSFHWILLLCLRLNDFDSWRECPR